MEPCTQRLRCRMATVLHLCSIRSQVWSFSRYAPPLQPHGNSSGFSTPSITTSPDGRRCASNNDIPAGCIFSYMTFSMLSSSQACSCCIPKQHKPAATRSSHTVTKSMQRRKAPKETGSLSTRDGHNYCLYLCSLPHEHNPLYTPIT